MTALDPKAPTGVERDRLGVPLNLLGRHDEDLYGAIARVVTLSSLLDERLHLLDLRMRPLGSKRERCTMGQVIQSCRTHLPLVADEPTRSAIAAVLDEADQYRAARNDAAHSLFPAQADGRIAWWRQDGARLRTSPTNAGDDLPGQNPYRPTTLEGWTRLVAGLADLVVEVDQLTWRLPAARDASGDSLSPLVAKHATILAEPQRSAG